MAEIVLVYGFSLAEGEECELYAECQMFHMPFYGDTASPELRYVGIQFGYADSMFNTAFLMINHYSLMKSDQELRLLKR